ncbi:hypothetical protein PR202_gb01051 [Eleusine coracana subsp. coracana]|uniref:Uncharacterized protein n=1 Tax=Eleusine coracana subsp. coracana TaxID=191504 RepID=A0AAV5DUM4_ELECO|nr:hypothetical protein QOZ80_5BG0422520 [Eleusine coracana subsp. coracana]GJN14253.1 hypothetical protein PR202_gb01051 [Eleusine coracana subsp. coracana]
MLSSSGDRRLVVLIRGNAAAAGGGINPFQPQAHPQPHAARFSHRYLSTRAAIAPDPNPSRTTTASYLVASCGLSPAAAAAVVATHGLHIVSTAKADAVLALLRHYGFSDTQIAYLIRQSPRLLLIDPDKILRPKLEFFASLSFPVGYLAHKSILARSLNEHIIPCVEFLRGILDTDANIRLAVPRNPIALNFNVKKKMRPALQALRRGGLSDEVISKLVLIHIGVLGLAPDRIAGIIEDLEALGLPVSDSRFVYGFRFMSTISREKWLQKVALYRSLGVSKGDLLRAFRTQPSIMLISGESIKKKLRFFLEDLKLDLSYVMQRPVVIGYSLEKCIIPRCVVLSVLMRKGKIDRGIDLLRALLGNSKGFSKQYVLRYAGDIPDVVAAYEGKIKFEGFKDQMV